MPKLNDNWKKAVVYLFRSPQDAKNASLEDPQDWPQHPGETNAKAASGFLVEYQTKRGAYLYVVTNRHVVTGGCAVPRLTLKDGSSLIIPAVEDEWYYRILQTDLAVLPLRNRSLQDSTQAIGLREHHGSDELFLPSHHKLINHSVHVGDDVVMIGRYYPVSGGAENEPVARFGNLASWPPRKVKLKSVTEPVDALLVEMRSHSGYSGSPVFLFEGVADRLQRALREAMDRISTDFPYSPQVQDLDWPDVRFLGVDCGHFNENMAIVIPWYKVIELIKSDGLEEIRAEMDRELPASVAEN